MRVSDKTVIASTPKLSSRITAVDLSPDGKILLTGSYDGIGRVWDSATGKLLQSCEGHEASIVSVAFSPDGKRFATGGLDGTCRLWDSETAKNILVIREEEARYHRLSFSPDGKRLLTSGPGSEPHVWNCENGEKVLTLKVDPEQVTSARFSPNGISAAVATRSNRIYLCNLINGKSDNMVRQNAGEIVDFAFSPDATKLLTVNMNNNLLLHRVPLGWGIIVFDQNGTKTTSPDYFFNLSGASRSTPKASGYYLERWLEDQGLQADDTPMVQSGDNKWTLTHNDGALRLWRTETGSLHTTLVNNLRSPVARSAFSPDDRLVLAQLETGEVIAYPSMNWNSISPKDDWEKRLKNLKSLQADQILQWLDSASPKKP